MKKEAKYNIGVVTNITQSNGDGRGIRPRNEACNVHLFKDDALGVGSTRKRLLPFTTQITLLEVLVCPAFLTAVQSELAPSSHTTCLTYIAEKTVNK